MAHVLIAADLGGSSIKLARFEASFRRLVLSSVQVVPAPPAEQPDEKAEERVLRQLSALAAHLAAQKVHAEELVVGLPGDTLSFRLVDLPFSNAKQIEAVLGYELESQILAPVEELVLDFVIVGPVKRGAEPSGETRVLVAAAPRSLIESVVKAAGELSLPLRTVCAAGLSYAALLDEPAAAGGEEAAAPITLVVDVGALTSDVCVTRGARPLLARTISRGGRHLTAAVAQAFQLDEAAAEKAKVEAGFLAGPDTPRLSPSQKHMDEAVRRALVPLVRELRQTIASFHASYGEGVSRLMLAGGGARLPGIDEHLAAELGVPVLPLGWPAREGWVDVPAETRGLVAVAVAMGAATAMPGSNVNFRKGDYAYRSDFSFLRAKAMHLSVAAMLVVLFAGLDAWASYKGLRKEHDMLALRLKAATREVFGKERDDLSNISDELTKGPRNSAVLPVPSSSCFDLLEDLSAAVPPGDKIRLDIEELDFHSKKLMVKGTTETAQQVDDLADALKKLDCVEEVTKGKIIKRAYTPPPPPADAAKDKAPDKDKDKDKPKGPTELSQFTINIKSSCP